MTWQPCFACFRFLFSFVFFEKSFFLPISLLFSAVKRIIFSFLFMFIIDNIIFLQPPHKIVILLYSFAFNLFAPLMRRGFSFPPAHHRDVYCVRTMVKCVQEENTQEQKESLFAQPDAIKNSMRVVRCSGIFILLLLVERK